MASFAADVKNEIARIVPLSSCCAVAELAALLRIGANISFGRGETFGMSYHVENAAVARRVLQLLREVREGINTEVTVTRNRRLKKNNSYLVSVKPSEAGRELFLRLGFLEGGRLNIESDRKILKKNCCCESYLRGAFLGGGSVSRPEASCHLEITTRSYSIGDMLYRLFCRMGYPAGFTDRKESYVTYLKEGDAILAFLSMAGATEAAEAFEVARNVKELREQVNRLVNCETANLQKAIDAAGRQLSDIQTLEENGGLSALPRRVKEAAELRLAAPEATLAELAASIGISKSAFAHRMRKLHLLAEASSSKQEAAEAT